jgi:hypothetical protein
MAVEPFKDLVLGRPVHRCELSNELVHEQAATYGNLGLVFGD